MIKEFEFYHGVVFAKLIHASDRKLIFESFGKKSNASYVINHQIGLYIKHSIKRMSPWRFSMQKIHQEEILEMKKKLTEIFILLVCGDDGIVTLTFDELKVVLNDSHKQIEWLSASRSPRKEYTIKGSDGSLEKKIGKIDFTNRILESVHKLRQKMNN